MSSTVRGRHLKRCMDTPNIGDDHDRANTGATEKPSHGGGGGVQHHAVHKESTFEQVVDGGARPPQPAPAAGAPPHRHSDR
ncbi:hypothetical protein ACP70R_036232 [Stipagrostis hirtigluma subsp. patula]